jgi:2-hydroxychromene-2-carboxylate isomerase
MGVIEFWYEFGSTYSYPAAMRIEPLAAGLAVAAIPARHDLPDARVE